MPLGRSGKIYQFPLNVALDGTSNASIREIQGRYVFVSSLPPGADQKIRMSLDGEDVGFVVQGRRFDSCGAGSDLFRKLGITSPVLSGTLEIFVTNEDCLPNDNGGAAATPRFHRAILWPPPQITKIGGPFLTIGEYFGGNTTLQLWDNIATNMGAFADGGGFPCGQFVSPQKSSLSFHSCMLPLLTLPAGFGLVRPPFRVWRWSWLMRLQAAVAIGANTNVTLMPADTGQPLISGNNAGFGVMGNGGTWAYGSRIAFGGGFAEFIDLGIATTLLTRFGMSIISASDQGAAVFTLSINDAPKIVRAFDGGLLPGYGAGPGGLANRFQPTVDVNGGGTLQMGGMECIQGPFTEAGAAVGALA